MLESPAQSAGEKRMVTSGPLCSTDTGVIVPRLLETTTTCTPLLNTGEKSSCDTIRPNGIVMDSTHEATSAHGTELVVQTTALLSTRPWLVVQVMKLVVPNWFVWQTI